MTFGKLLMGLLLYEDSSKAIATKNAGRDSIRMKVESSLPWIYMLSALIMLTCVHVPLRQIDRLAYLGVNNVKWT